METDLRIIKTKKAIETAFTNLVEVKGYRNVKFVDIAEKANVNRNTIYLRYNSKEDIITSIILNSISVDINDEIISKFIKNRYNRFKIEALFTELFKNLDQNAELYRILLLQEELIGFFNIGIRKIKKILLNYVKNNTKNDSILEFLLYGLFGIIKNYMIYAKTTPEENIKLMSDLTIYLLRKIQG